MKYWQHNETGRLLAIDLQMAPSNWTEITKEEYDIFLGNREIYSDNPNDDEGDK